MEEEKMMEAPKITPFPTINIEEELEQRLLGVKNARTILVEETQEERNKRVEIANYALEDFSMGLLLGLKLRSR